MSKYVSILMLLSAFLLLNTIPTNAEPESPMNGNLSAVVLSDNNMVLEFIITSSIDAPNTSAEILLPESFLLLNGSLKWSGNITKGEVINFQATVRATN